MDRVTKIAPDFSSYEFVCPCGCGTKKMSIAFLKRLQAARTIYGDSMIPTSGARCKEYNEEIGGSSDSTHVPEFNPDNQGHAADISCTNSRNRIKMIDAFRAAGFNRIGIMKNAIHVDDGERLRKDKEANVLFHYYD